MKQLVFIHGGETFATYDDYLTWLRALPYDPKKETPKRWRDGLLEELGEKWEGHVPLMPGKYNAKYPEWELWFEKVIPYLNDNVVLIGHSLGGFFLLKYLSEHTFPVSVAGTFLVASPFYIRGGGFDAPESVEQFISQAGQTFLYYSEDDTIVPFATLEKYRALVPNATIRTFADRGHFLSPEFPEILTDIRSLWH